MHTSLVGRYHLMMPPSSKIKRLKATKADIPLTSSLNIFHFNGEQILMAISENDIPAPHLNFPSYPKIRTSPTYTVEKCEHRWTKCDPKQLRRGDEIISIPFQCDFCSKIKVV